MMCKSKDRLFGIELLQQIPLDYVAAVFTMGLLGKEEKERKTSCCLL
jgi:hypothetical protein